jgi:Restriction endonuclease S subunits
MMNAHHPPYPAYKPSGADWLGDIPAHWEVRRLKFVASVVYSNVDKHSKEEELPVRLCNYTDIYKNERITNSLNFMEATATIGEIRKFALKKGDIIITKDSEEWQDIAVPALVSEELDNVICGYHLALIRPFSKVVDNGYLFRSFQAAAINYQFQVAASGITRYGLGKQALGNSLFLVPPLAEQRAIAEYLDRETAHVDALIAKKRALIDLLECQRTALISHAVTKGLNPAAPLKPSGVDWLGEIPAHWEVRRLKFVASINPDSLPETTPKDYAFEYIDIGNVSSDGRVSAIQEYTFETAPTRARRKVQAGDTIISTVRTYLQAIAFIEDYLSNYIVSTGFAVLRPKENVHSRFLYYLVRSQVFVDAVMAHSSGVSYPAIALTSLAGLWGLLPPLAEQRAIAEYLDRETAQIDRLKGELEASIDLLQRYRTALISAAVTGKIDVRAPAAASCPSA